jgi:hypothetical protein
VLSSSPGLSSEFYCQIKWLNLRHRRQKGHVKMKGNADELASPNFCKICRAQQANNM